MEKSPLGLTSLSEAKAIEFRQLAQQLQIWMPQFPHEWSNNCAGLEDSIRHFRALLYLLARKIPRKPRYRPPPSPPELILPPPPDKPIFLSQRGHAKAVKEINLITRYLLSEKQEILRERPAICDWSIQYFDRQSQERLSKFIIWTKRNLATDKARNCVDYISLLRRWTIDSTLGLVAANEVKKQFDKAVRPLQIGFDNRMYDWRRKNSSAVGTLEALEVRLQEFVLVINEFKEELTLKEKIGEFTRSEPKVRESVVNWELLPPGTRISLSAFERWLTRTNYSEKDISKRHQRFKYAFKLKPKDVYKGTKGMDGYFCFVYDWTRSVLLERVDYGNAAFVIHRQWKTLSHLTKDKLRGRTTKELTKIVHRHAWQWKKAIKLSLDSGRTTK